MKHSYRQEIVHYQMTKVPVQLNGTERVISASEARFPGGGPPSLLLLIEKTTPFVSRIGTGTKFVSKNRSRIRTR